MTIDTNELRRLAQAALTGPDGISLSWIKLLQDFQQEASPATILELLDRLEAAEKELAELRSSMKFRTSLIGRTEAERDALRAKVAEMEKQKPVWFIDERGEPKRYHKSKADYCKYGGLDLLYALPGAKGE